MDALVTNFDNLRGRGAKRGRGDWKKALSLPHRLIFDEKDDIYRLVQVLKCTSWN